MKILIFTIFCLIVASHAFPNRNQGKQDLKAQISAHKDQIKSFLLALVHKFAPKDQIEQWYHLSPDDRSCIGLAQNAIAIFYFGGAINTEQEWVDRLKQACPNVSASIDSWYTQSKEQRQKSYDAWSQAFQTLPQDIQNVITKANETFESLRKSGKLMGNKKAIEAAFLPILQDFLATQNSWDAVAQQYPSLQDVLANNGTLRADFITLITATIEYLQNGKMSADTKAQYNAAQQAFKGYFRRVWATYSPMLKEQYNKAEEKTFSPETEAALNEEVDAALNNAAKMSPGVPAVPTFQE